MEISSEVLEKIEKISAPKIIAVSGFGGSGKTSFSNKLSSIIGAPVIGIDSFQKDATTVKFSFWETMDFPRFEREVLIPFANQEECIKYKNFRWDGNLVDEFVEVKPWGVLIVEGVGIFRPELIKYFDFKIWIDCPLDEAEARGIKRDCDVHKNIHDDKWYKIWRENDIQYFETFKPKENADLVITNF